MEQFLKLERAKYSKKGLAFGKAEENACFEKWRGLPSAERALYEELRKEQERNDNLQRLISRIEGAGQLFSESGAARSSGAASAEAGSSGKKRKSAGGTKKIPDNMTLEDRLKRLNQYSLFRVLAKPFVEEHIRTLIGQLESTKHLSASDESLLEHLKSMLKNDEKAKVPFKTQNKIISLVWGSIPGADRLFFHRASSVFSPDAFLVADDPNDKTGVKLSPRAPPEIVKILKDSAKYQCDVYYRYLHGGLTPEEKEKLESEPVKKEEGEQKSVTFEGVHQESEDRIDFIPEPDSDPEPKAAPGKRQKTQKGDVSAGKKSKSKADAKPRPKEKDRKSKKAPAKKKKRETSSESSDSDDSSGSSMSSEDSSSSDSE